MGCRRWFAGAMFFLFLAVPPGFAAEVTFPAIELLTRGAMNGSRFELQTLGQMQIRVDGGEQISGQARLSFMADSPDLFGMLTMDSISLSWAGLFGPATGLTLFYGEGDTLGEDPSRSGSLYDLYSGHFYCGIHPLAGTGLRFDLAPGPQRLKLSWYMYQDSRVDGDPDPLVFEPGGFYSSDIRALLTLPRLRLETFLGATFPAPEAPAGWYRGGLVFHAAEEGVEFFAQVGVPRWSPSEEELDIRLVYMLFEPRVRFGKVGFIPTFFWHPAWHQQEPTDRQAFDLNLHLLIGGWPGLVPEETRVSGGLETHLSYVMEEDGATMSEIRVAVSPYLRLIRPGLRLDFRFNGRLLPFVPEELVEFFMGARVEL